MSESATLTDLVVVVCINALTFLFPRSPFLPLQVHQCQKKNSPAHDRSVQPCRQVCASLFTRTLFVPVYTQEDVLPDLSTV